MKRLFTIIAIFMMAGLSNTILAAATGEAPTEVVSRQILKKEKPALEIVKKDIATFQGTLKANEPAETNKTIRTKGTTQVSGEIKDEHGIITQPAEGEVKEYNRLATNTCFYLNKAAQQVNLTYQSGTATLVECADGTVYWKNPVSKYTTDAWIKGKKEGSTITFATKQPVDYHSGYTATLSVRWGYFDYSTNAISPADNYSDSFILDIKGDTLVMRGTQVTLGSTATYFPGIFWDDNDDFQGSGDCGVTLTLKKQLDDDTNDPFDASFNYYDMEASIEDGVISISATNADLQAIGLELYTNPANVEIPAGTFVISDSNEAGTALKSAGVVGDYLTECWAGIRAVGGISDYWLLVEGTVVLSYDENGKLKVVVDGKNSWGQTVAAVIVYEPKAGDQFVDNVSGLKFEITAVGETNTVKVIYNNYQSTDYDIPETVSYYNKSFAVTEIGDGAFDSCESLQSVSMQSVVKVGNRAFAECENLTTVNMPEVTEIGHTAFGWCSSLETVTKPKATTIGDNAFRYCTSLKD